MYFFVKNSQTRSNLSKVRTGLVFYIRNEKKSYVSLTFEWCTDIITIVLIQYIQYR